MSKLLWFIVAALVIGAAVGVFFHRQESELVNLKDNLIRVSSPKPNEIIKSPLLVTGEARGYWFFEASFPVKLLDENGTQIAAKPAQAKGEWMTTDFAPFEVSLEFSAPAGKTGTLILEKDNPSGLAQNADELRIPVRFK